MNRIKVLNTTIEKLGLELPEPYIQFLKNDEPNFEIELDNVYWNMATTLESDWDGQVPLTLESDFSLDRIPPLPFIHALKMFLKSAEEYLEGSVIQCVNGENFSIDRLSRGNAIGEDNGNLLFLDVETQAVFAFYHDGFYISKISNSFSDLLRLADCS